MNAIDYAKQLRELVNIELENNRQRETKTDFNEIVMISEFGAFAYDVRIYGTAVQRYDSDTNAHDSEIRSLYLEVLGVYDEDGETLNLSNYDLNKIGQILENNIDIELN